MLLIWLILQNSVKYFFKFKKKEMVFKCWREKLGYPNPDCGKRKLDYLSNDLMQSIL